MAVTKIKPIHTSLKAAIDYVSDAAKTDGKALISSYLCSPEAAHIEFLDTACRARDISFNGAPDGHSGTFPFGAKEGKKEVLAYHVIQSFKPGEVTPEVANEIGMDLAKNFTGGTYEYIVSTHIDKGHIHNQKRGCVNALRRAS